MALNVYILVLLALAASGLFSSCFAERIICSQELRKEFQPGPSFPKNGKPLQVMHYGVEEASRHFDYFGNTTLVSNAPLMATLVLYLSNVSQGGEILFPGSEMKGKFSSDCKRASNILRPIKGNAILFFNSHPNASPDKSSSHTRCPVLKGEMWCATKFFLLIAIDEVNILSESDGSDCTDEDDNCPSWAAAGECQGNPVFMTGSPDYSGTCRKSCKAC